MRIANRVFTERAISQVEVVSHLLGYPSEFAHVEAWTFLNTSSLYWQIFRLWPHLRQSASGVDDANDGHGDDSILLEEAGQRVTLVQAYPHRGVVLHGLCLYDYMSIVKLKRKAESSVDRGQIPLDERLAAGRKRGYRLCGSQANTPPCAWMASLSMDFAGRRRAVLSSQVRRFA